MQIGDITGYIDVAQLVLYAFWIFFFGLILYLQRESKREGFPMQADPADRFEGPGPVRGVLRMPEPKTFRLHDGSEKTVPGPENDSRVLKAETCAGFPGAPLRPVGDPMQAELGPGAYALRADEPDLTIEGEPKIVPLRAADGFELESRDPDPRGMPVVAADRKVAGTVREVWVDRMEVMVRYLEVEVGAGADEGAAARTVLLPITFCKVDRKLGQVKVRALMADQFGGVPALANPDRITLLEEEKVTAYYGAGTLYATPARAEPWL